LPVFGVKLLTSPNDIAILVETNSTESFKAQLFHFGNQSRKMGAEFYNLENGTYTLALNGKRQYQFEIEDKNRKINVEIPQQKLTILTVDKV